MSLAGAMDLQSTFAACVYQTIMTTSLRWFRAPEGERSRRRGQRDGPLVTRAQPDRPKVGCSESRQRSKCRRPRSCSLTRPVPGIGAAVPLAVDLDEAPLVALDGHGIVEQERQCRPVLAIRVDAELAAVMVERHVRDLLRLRPVRDVRLSLGRSPARGPARPFAQTTTMTGTGCRRCSSGRARARARRSCLPADRPLASTTSGSAAAERSGPRRERREVDEVDTWNS